VRLKSLTLNGFKSFPDRTRLEFGPGVSVVVGPNGSGKSNVTDAVLWAMGEQSPLAVRGQSMQDVIFGGGRGVQERSAAEVEIVLDNSDGTIDVPLSEISIVRRLERGGEGGYRLNGARCRLTDVLEVLSDTGLGKETHSVISQGRVEAIVTSKPRDRRLLIEEAAGLGKHRKRRRRAQLKLERTQENLDRALDIEREARTRLRPLKRQAEAAELHERLERQILEARWELLRDLLRARRVELAAAEQSVVAARSERSSIESSLEQVVARRGEAERALAERGERRDALSGRLYEARSARDRLALRAEQVGADTERLARRIERVEAELAELAADGEHDDGASELSDGGRLAALEAELAEIEASRSQQLEDELEGLERELAAQREALQDAQEVLGRAAEGREHADAAAAQARDALSTAERDVHRTRAESARVGAELAAANQFLRSHSGVSDHGPRPLSSELRVADGYELALAAALGGRLDASLVEDVPGAEAVLDRAGPEGGSALLAKPAARAGLGEDLVDTPPAPGARRLTELLSGPPEVLALAGRLLAGAWVVERLEELPRDFAGIAATRSGRVWFARSGEVRQLSEGGTELLLARRNQRERLVAEVEQAAQAEVVAKASGERALEGVRAAEAARAGAEDALREAQRGGTEAGEAVRRSEWLIERRRAAPAEGALAVRKAEIEGELAAERRQAEQLAAQRRARRDRRLRLRAQREADLAAAPLAERLSAAIAAATEAIEARLEVLEAELAEDRRAGEEMASRLRECAAEEAGIQSSLRAAGEAVTESEVAAQRLRDQAAEAELESAAVAERLGLPDPAQAGAEHPADERGEAGAHRESAPGEAEPPFEPLEPERRRELEERVQRLTRRREQLGPVNPLAQDEYAEAVEYVEELESQRSDLETALRELRTLIKETDRQIEETFEETFQAAARNFEELVGDVFPGGTGRLRLVEDDLGPRPVLGGQPLPRPEEGEAAIEAAAEAEAQAEDPAEEQLPGVEIEITPAGKSSKRLTLLSGGEKSMTALAFLFAVFLARPCPFYILDEVEAALDDLNLDRFLALLRRYAGRAQFIVITHQKRTMEAADWLFGVSMGGDGVSKVLSRRLPGEEPQEASFAALA
jgi:chromosome segregation protein